MHDNVLVVDDDPVYREIVRTYLGQLGTKGVFVASDGFGALDILQEKGDQIDLVVLDLNMPQCDGIELLSKIEELSFSGAIVIVSGESPAILNMAEHLGQQYDLNIIGTFKKPVTKAEIELWLH